MKYGHTVKMNGVLYPAGVEVPVEEPMEDKRVDEESVVEQNDEDNVEEPEKPNRGRKPKE